MVLGILADTIGLDTDVRPMSAILMLELMVLLLMILWIESGLRLLNLLGVGSNRDVLGDRGDKVENKRIISESILSRKMLEVNSVGFMMTIEDNKVNQVQGSNREIDIVINNFENTSDLNGKHVKDIISDNEKDKQFETNNNNRKKVGGGERNFTPVPFSSYI